MKPHILSIWHTGTRSTLEYFGMPQNHLHYTHLIAEYDGMQARRSASLYDPLLMPMRNPCEVWNSWNKRSHVRYGRPNGGANNPEVFLKAYTLAHELWQLHTVFLVPVDLPERGDYLDVIEQMTDLRPAVDSFPWVTDAIPEKPVTFDAIDWASVYSLTHSMGLSYENPFI